MNVALTLIVGLTLKIFGAAEAQEGKLDIFCRLLGIRTLDFLQKVISSRPSSRGREFLQFSLLEQFMCSPTMATIKTSLSSVVQF